MTLHQTHNMKDSLTQEYEEKISELELAREKDYEKIVALSETLEHVSTSLFLMQSSLPYLGVDILILIVCCNVRKQEIKCMMMK